MSMAFQYNTEGRGSKDAAATEKFKVAAERTL